MNLERFSGVSVSNAVAVTPMKLPKSLLLTSVAVALLGTPRTAEAETKNAVAPPTASQIVARVGEADSWGLGGADVEAKAVVTEKSGKTRALHFNAKSRRHPAPLGKSVITFQAPADVAG